MILIKLGSFPCPLYPTNNQGAIFFIAHMDLRRWQSSQCCGSYHHRGLGVRWDVEKLKYDDLGGGFKYCFYFHPYLGKWSNLTNIFLMGWNHQLVYYGWWFIMDDDDDDDDDDEDEWMNGEWQMNDEWWMMNDEWWWRDSKCFNDDIDDNDEWWMFGKDCGCLSSSWMVCFGPNLETNPTAATATTKFTVVRWL